MAAKVY